MIITGSVMRHTVRHFASLLALACLVLCSCFEEPKVKMGGVGEDPSLVQREPAIRSAGELMKGKGFATAQIVEEISSDTSFRFRFATNGVVLPSTVVVDRKNGKATFETARN